MKKMIGAPLEPGMVLYHCKPSNVVVDVVYLIAVGTNSAFVLNSDGDETTIHLGKLCDEYYMLAHVVRDNEWRKTVYSWFGDRGIGSHERFTNQICAVLRNQKDCSW